MGRPGELIGWAAFRALPAALGLALVLAGTAGWLGLAGGRGSVGAPPPPAPAGWAAVGRSAPPTWWHGPRLLARSGRERSAGPMRRSSAAVCVSALSVVGVGGWARP